MDIIIYISIALVYNIFVHNLACTVYKDYQYEEKNQNTIIMLIIFGIMGIIVAKFITNSNVSKGLYYGGILLLVTSFLVNWDVIVDETRIFFTAIILGGLIFYEYKRNKK